MSFHPWLDMWRITLIDLHEEVRIEENLLKKASKVVNMICCKFF